jgi:hypothetical protein
MAGKGAVRKAATSLREGGTYAVTSNSLTAQVANARLTQPRRKYSGITKAGARGVLDRRTTEVLEKDLVRQYGSMSAASIKKQTRTVAAVRGETDQLIKAARQQLLAGKKTIEEVGLIFKQGSMAQSAAAAIAKARAVQEATGASDSQAAAFAMDMMMARQQHEWAQEDFENQQALADEQIATAQGEEARVNAQGVMLGVPSLASGVGNAVRTVANQNLAAGNEGGTWDAQAAFDVYLANSGVAANSPEALIARRAITNMKNGQNAGVATLDATKFIYAGAPGATGKDGWLKTSLGVASTGLQVETTSARASWLASHPEASYTAATAPGQYEGDGEASSLESVLQFESDVLNFLF